MWNGLMQGKSIQEGHLMRGDKRKNEKRIHPTQRPIALYLRQFQQFAPPGYKVLDTQLW
jgi:site-specific DNA-methyltransferase (adenine-specific)